MCIFLQKIIGDGLNSDLLLTMCKMKRWQRVEAIAEVVQCLNAHEQRLIKIVAVILTLVQSTFT